MLLALALAVQTGCRNRQPSQPRSVPNAGANAVVCANSYQTCKKSIDSLRLRYKSQWPRLKKSERERLFSNAVANTIVPHWMGTPWDFNGTTETPGQGSIACGYFVTTVLRDAGLPLQRVKLAQCASEEMICSLVRPALVQRYSQVPIAAFVTALMKQGPGLYIVGLDSHTGFLYHDGQELYFIHASYIGQKKVVKEIAANAAILQASRYRITGKLSADETVLEKWMGR
jgi:hypothetical protein